MDGQKIRDFHNRFTRSFQTFMKGKLQFLQSASSFFKTKNSDLTMKIIKAALFSSLSFIFGACSMAFDSHPTGIALLCSSSEYTLFILIGNIAAALVKTPQYASGTIIVLCAVFALRLSLVKILRYFDTPGKFDKFDKPDKKAKALSNINFEPFCESFALRAVICALASLSIGICRIIAIGLSFYALGALIFSVFASALFCFILSGLDQNSKAIALHRDASGILLCFLIVFALREYSIFGFSIGLCACTFTVLFYSDRHDVLRSCVCSLICGLAISTLDSPMFALIGFSYALIKKYYKKAALFVSVLCAAAYSLTVFQTQALTQKIPDIICASLLFAAFLRLFIFPSLSFSNKKASYFQTESATNQDIALYYKDDTTICAKPKTNAKSFEVVSESLCELSDILNKLSLSLKKPTYDDVCQICRDVCSRHCSLCACSSKCYREGGGGEDMVPTLTKSAFQNGSLSCADVAHVIGDNEKRGKGGQKTKCKRADIIVSDINSQLSELQRTLSKPDCNQAFALCCKSLSKLLQQGMAMRDEEEQADISLTRNLIEVLKKNKFSFESAGVYGKRKKYIIITGIDPIGVSTQSKKLRKQIGEALECNVGAPVFSNIGALDVMTMTATQKLKCECECVCLSKKGENVCGDTSNTFEENGNYYAVISDGTGSGQEAAISSRICCSFAEKLVRCGSSLSCVIEAINDFILTQSFECGATADLFRLDLFTGEAHFIKSGTPPSFVIRNDNIFKIESKTMPIGLTHEINTEEITMPIIEGDLIIMASDGLFFNHDEALVASQLALENKELSCSELSNLMVEKAKIKTKLNDDMSLCIIKVLAA